MKKYYTVEEVAKKFRVSKSHVYELVKRGEIKKENGIGKVIRIPASEVKTYENKQFNLKYNKDKVEIIKTHLGDIRKIKETDEYIISDIARALRLREAWIIIKKASKNKFRKISIEESKMLGLGNNSGILSIKYSGIVEYLGERSLNLNNLNHERFLNELKVNDNEKVKPEEAEDKPIKFSNIFEGHNVEIITLKGKVLFELYSTGMALGQVKKNGVGELYPRKERIDKTLENADIKPCVHRGHKYLTEEMLYDFMLETKTEKCKSFRKWVTNEVLPTIRKSGGYVDNTNKFTDFYFSNLSQEVRETIKQELINRNETLLSRKRELATKVKEIDNEYDVNNKMIESLA
ncbi:MAG: BRO family protein [uncultured Clostridium sp.]